MRLKRKRVGLVLFLAVLAIAVTGCKTEEEKDNESNPDYDSEENLEDNEAENGIDFPYKSEDDALVIQSVFQYSGWNLDCNGEEGEDVGAIQLDNCSEQYLASAKIVVVTADGEEFNFQIEDLPAGNTVMAFETENKELDAHQTVTAIEIDAEYAEQSMQESVIQTSVSETDITLKNLSTEKIENITLVYHCTLDGIYFGGKSCQQQVALLNAGESITVKAEEYYLGEAAVANIKY